jgi:hypothetical protein
MLNIQKVAVVTAASQDIGVAAAYHELSPRIVWSLIPARTDPLPSARIQTRLTTTQVRWAPRSGAQYCPSS